MRVLVFAHSGGSGGAEHALRHLVGLLIERHQVEVVLPSVEQGEAAYYQSLGLTCHLLKSPLSLPNVSSALLNYAVMDLQGAASALAGRGFEIALSNTLAALHGALIAHGIGIPHVCYAHELLGDEDLLPGALTPTSYLELVQESSVAILSCSQPVAEQFAPAKRARLAVLEPYDYGLPPLPRKVERQGDCVLQVIGTQSLRKNPQFAVTLVKALAMRGLAVRLDFLGSRNSASGKLQRAIEKRGVPVRLLDHVADPYATNASARVVTLICAQAEPYGLTIPESLRRGTPVVASRSGGPEQILPKEYLYPVDDLDGCVRILERLFATYEHEVRNAEILYEYLSRRQSRSALLDALDASLTAARAAAAADAAAAVMPSGAGSADAEVGPRAAGGAEVTVPETRLTSLVRRMACMARPPIGLETVAQHISAVACEQGLDWSAASVLDRIAHDARQPGAAVMADLKRFDVVPYAMSAQMDALYKQGLGLAIELASTWSDAARLHMAAYIVASLDDLRMHLGRAPRVLALGDGIGLDSMRLTAAGFDVSYMDYDGSAMARIAKRNFERAAADRSGGGTVTVLERVNAPFDAIVCLEVIEHVPAPAEFGHMIAAYLVDGGLLFISDCFNGVEARWPTHLYGNEVHAGSLPLLLGADFEFQGVHKVPYGKPFVLRKRPQTQAGGAEQALLNRHVLANFVSSQIDIGL